ncbi:PrpF domain-containing protein [Streptosporangium sp. CA-135522]|uniref:PrpF domain-containing protein n=1 Tax=Streptosporangium sp. CA-135522 TaxID=3240072 RepID=UPI003D8F7DCA
MIGHLAYAMGSPCPTLVLDARHLPREREPLLAALAEARRWLAAAGGEHVLKIALIQPSTHPLFDLDYRFIQALPGDPAGFDLRGSCGHSVLSAITAAAEAGMLPRLAPGLRVRVNVLNNGDYLACEVDEVSRETVRFTMHFLYTPPKPVSRLLLTGEPRTAVDVDGERVEVSLVSAGNPYVFVSAPDAGVSGTVELYGDDPGLFERLVRIRGAAAAHLGWPADSVFPKVAVTMPVAGGRIAVRAVSVPGWHPTLALTGAACLGAATGIAETIPWLAARQAGCEGNGINVLTPGGSVEVLAAINVHDAQRRIAWITVGDRRVAFRGSFFIEPLAHFQFKETAECLSVSA